MPKTSLRPLLAYMILGALLACSCASPKLYKRALASKPYDVIIVPGVPFDGKNWDLTMKGRVIWADYLIKQGIAKHVIFSGGAVYTPYVEAKVMALYARALGIPEACIFTEEKAEHSTENVYYSYLMAKKLGFTNIALASDPYQCNILKRFMKKHIPLPVARIPFRIKILKTVDGVQPTIDASSAKAENFRSIKETQSRKYRRNGTRGKNIVFEAE